ncbi:MAG TPA: response regulator transcription factor [Nocardioides sp.]|nr:response regulator transcription factor [Nocardioides sp.]
MPGPLRIGVLNDFPIVVAGLTAMLAPYRERVEVVEQHTGVDLAGDVDLVLYDTFGAADHAADGVRSLVRRCRVPVVVFSWTTDPELVGQALEAGAAGFLPKSLAPEQLVLRLEQLQGGLEVDPAQVGRRRARASDWPGAEHGLTPREAEVVALIARGLSNKDIADRSYLSINSVKTYIRTAYRKMGVKTRPQAVLWLLRHGFDPEP